MSTALRDLSLWHDTLVTEGVDPLTPRPGLDGDTEADVAIVGAGYTGLWTAYYLLRHRPDLRVLLLEAQVAGFGASGRNGGWCSALFPRGTAALARRHGRPAALAMRAAMNQTVTEVGTVVAAEGIDCHWRQGGTVRLARTAVQWERARAEASEDDRFDHVDGVELWDAATTADHLRATRVLGATYTPHCARIHPGRLVRGLARVVEARGARIAEGTRALRIARGLVETEAGTVRAAQVVRATEAWTTQLPGSERDVIPVYSLMVATHPLPASFWDQVGLARGETFSDHRHLIVYGQRTADDRLAFGGRGAPYHRGSRIEPAFDRDQAVFAALRATVRELFPALPADCFSHAWGGPLGIPRDWCASVGVSDGVGWAGGYVGDGVGTTNLAGRTLADLLLGIDSDLVHLPWVGHRSRRWEPEPLRWLGVNAGLRAMTVADAEERLTRHPSRVAHLMGPLTGH